MYKYLIIISFSCLFSQTTGKLSGSVNDSDKNPLYGVNVVIQDTYYGAASDDDGLFYIINVPPGSYTVRFDIIGYKSIEVQDVSISVNKTTRLDVELEETAVEGEVVFVKASKLSTKKDQSGTIKNISEKQIEILPIKDVSSIVSMQAGVVDGHFRGGRDTEVTYLVDGVRTDDTFSRNAQTVYLEPSVLKDLEVITGTFNAEYGRAMSGVVNQVTKDGGDEYEGSFSSRYENYFTGNSHIFPGIDDLDINLNQDYSLQYSGPIIKDKVTFFLNYRYQNNLGHLNGYDYFNAGDYSNFNADSTFNYYSEHSGSHVIQDYCSNSKGAELLSSTTREPITDNSECQNYGDCEIIYSQIIYNGTYSRTLFSNSSNMITSEMCSNQVFESASQSSEYFLTTRFIPAQVRAKTDNHIAMNNFISTSYLGKISFRPIGPLKISLMHTQNNYEGSWYSHFYKYSPDSRSTNHNDNKFTSLFINYMFSQSAFFDLKISNNKKSDYAYVYEDPSDSRYVSDFFSRSESSFLQGGHDKNHNTKILEDLSLKFDLNWQADPINNIKFGLDYVAHDLLINNYTIRDSSLTDIVYTPYIDKGVRSAYSEEYDVTCYEFSAYLQDKMEFSDMVLNFGLRYDMFDPNTIYPSDYRNPANDIIGVAQSDTLSAETKYQISPRFALSYQVGQAALLRFSYGHFFQMPPLYAMYSNSNWLISPNNYATILGNPNLEAEKTVNYELGFWQEINRDMGVEVVLFYKDIYNLLSTRTITTYNTVKYGLYSNKDYGNVRGLELVYDYNTGPISVVANYTFQYTRGIADSPTSSFSREGANQDPITKLIPLEWDQRHTMNVTAGYNTKKYGATLSIFYNSGSAYTFEPISENPLANVNLLPNNSYKPSNYTINLLSYYNLFKTGSRITFEIYNLFDTLNEYGVNSQTGRAYSAILNEADVASFRSNYTTIEDTYQDPSSYSAPRSLKIGLEWSY